MYGQLAANLAASIKNNSPEIGIHLVYNKKAISHLDEKKLSLFSSKKECPLSYCSRNGKPTPVMAKLYAYHLSPFENTILLDVDMVMTPRKKLGELFDELSNVGFTMENRGMIDLEKYSPGVHNYLWGDIGELMRAYNITKGYLYTLHSEFVYFNRSEANFNLFKDAIEIFKNPKCKIVEFNGDLPDEFAFAISMIFNNLYPHKCPYIPIYWHLTDSNKGASLEYVISNYYGYSVGGNNTPHIVRKRYNMIARAASLRFGIKNPYSIIPKKSVLRTRKVM